MPLRVTLTTGAVLALIYLWLAWKVVELRRSKGVGIGDGGVAELRQAIRVHGNFAEYVPFALLLIALLEGERAPYVVTAPLAIGLVLGRMLHAFGLGSSAGVSFGRFWGTALTWLVLAVSAIACGIYAWA